MRTRKATMTFNARTFWYVDGKIEECAVPGDIVQRVEPDHVAPAIFDVSATSAELRLRLERRCRMRDALNSQIDLFLPTGQSVERRYVDDVRAWMGARIAECATRIGQWNLQRDTPRGRMFDLARRLSRDAFIEAERMALVVERTMHARSYEILATHTEERRLFEEKFYAGKLSQWLSHELCDGWVYQLEKLADLAIGQEAGPAFALAMHLKHGA
jgi:hypothetical protein